MPENSLYMRCAWNNYSFPWRCWRRDCDKGVALKKPTWFIISEAKFPWDALVQYWWQSPGWPGGRDSLARTWTCFLDLIFGLDLNSPWVLLLLFSKEPQMLLGAAEFCVASRWWKGDGFPPPSSPGLWSSISLSSGEAKETSVCSQEGRFAQSCMWTREKGDINSGESIPE